MDRNDYVMSEQQKNMASFGTAELGGILFTGVVVQSYCNAVFS